VTRRFRVEIYEPAKRTTIASTAVLEEEEEASGGRSVEGGEAGHAGAKKLGVVELCTGCTASGIPALVLRACV